MALPLTTAQCKVASLHCATFEWQPQTYIGNEQIQLCCYLSYCHAFVYFHRFNKLNNLNDVFSMRFCDNIFMIINSVNRWDETNCRWRNILRKVIQNKFTVQARLLHARESNNLLISCQATNFEFNLSKMMVEMKLRASVQNKAEKNPTKIYVKMQCLHAML